MNPDNTRMPSNFNAGRLSHAYIVANALADSLAMAAVCSGNGKRPCKTCPHCLKAIRGIHPDVTIVKKHKNKRDITIDLIRELKKDVIVVPNEADKKVYIIEDAHLMNGNSQNALLKILEEPPTHAVLILKTDTPAELYSTIRSRCVELKSLAVDATFDDETTDTADGFFAALQNGNATLTEFMFRLEKLDKEQFTGFLTAARRKAAEKLRAAEAAGETETRIILSRVERVLVKAGAYLDFNVSAGHISGMICATLIRT